MTLKIARNIVSDAFYFKLFLGNVSLIKNPPKNSRLRDPFLLDYWEYKSFEDLLYHLRISIFYLCYHVSM